MLRQAIDATGISASATADVLGVSPSIFQEWVAGQRPIPRSYLQLLSSAIGIDLSSGIGRKLSNQDAAELSPAIWFRLKRERVIDEDRAHILLIRQLAFYLHEVEALTEERSVGWKTLFLEIRDNIDKQASPRKQGRLAAKIFRESRGLSNGGRGIGEILRGNMRSMGMLVLETPIKNSAIEGCCFYAGPTNAERPCVFANNLNTTWFRRNFLLAHELAHAIFDAESNGVTIDFYDTPDSEIMEERADSFARELLVPKTVLVTLANAHGMDWNDLRESDLATLVAHSHVEVATILAAAVEAELISREQAAHYKSLDITKQLKDLSTHALSTEEYIDSVGREKLDWVDVDRNTNLSSTSLRLPANYIKKVLELYEADTINIGKAAEFLMIDSDTFAERFKVSKDLDAYSE